MGTTDLFVELIVIGIGALIWMVMATLSIFGYTWVPLDKLLSVSALIPILSIIYIAGIVTDRIADVLFDVIWASRIQRKYYSSSSLARDDRRLIYIKNEYLADLIEYGRSRLRICRGWAFNAVLIMIASNFFIATQVPDQVLRIKLFIWVNLLAGFIAYFSWYSWYQLSDTQYRRIKGDAEFLRQGDGATKGRKNKASHD
jgi:drug/metabolite transporter (DMT)-like permease